MPKLNPRLSIGESDPELLRKLNGVDHPESISAERQRDLKYARAEAKHWLRDIGLATVRRDRECS